MEGSKVPTAAIPARTGTDLGESIRWEDPPGPGVDGATGATTQGSDPVPTVSIDSAVLDRLIGTGHVHKHPGVLALPHALGTALGFDDAGGAEDTVVLVAAPITGDQGIAATLVVAVDGHQDPSEVAALVESFAGQISLGIELFRARAQHERLVMAEDRSRIARGLHEHVIRTLFATGMRLQLFATRPGDAEIHRALTDAVADIDQAITQLRDTVFALEAPPGSRLGTRKTGLRADVLEIVMAATKQVGLDPEVSFVGSFDLVPQPTQEHVVAVVHEALVNVVRHAHASSVIVAVQVGAGQVRVVVTDNGIGMGTARPSGGLLATTITPTRAPSRHRLIVRHAGRATSLGLAGHEAGTTTTATGEWATSS